LHVPSEYDYLFVAERKTEVRDHAMCQSAESFTGYARVLTDVFAIAVFDGVVGPILCSHRSHAAAKLLQHIQLF